MPLPTIGNIVAEKGLPLRQVAGAATPGRPVRSVHVTDLSHPGRYVLPGELVLTNGLWLAYVDPATWVAEVAAAGATAVGFGLGTPYPALPDGLVAACTAHDLSLLEVPEGVPFAEIQAVVARRLAGDAEAAARRHLDRNRELVLRLADGAGHAGLVEMLRRETGLA
ncbi:PucR family transcriptional regulator ligand-binding domain-containing protein, partial [Patulibacter sp. S7RM1-6]